MWEILGVWPVDPQNTVFPDPFTRDVNTHKYYIWWQGKGRTLASREEIEGRECLASYPNANVEQRLRDYFAGRPNYDWEWDRCDDPKNFPTRKEFYKQYGYDFHWMDEEG